MAIRTLLVDDHARLRAEFAALLAAADGVEVVAEVGDGGGALAEARAAAPDVVVLDVHLPDVSGIVVARHLASAMPRVGVVALSMLGHPAVVAAMVSAGARGYVLKDDAPTHLVRAVRTVAAGGWYFSPGVECPLPPRADPAVGRSEPPLSIPEAGYQHPPDVPTARVARH